MKRLILATCAALQLIAAEPLPFDRDIARDGVTVRLERQQQAPLTDPDYGGGSGVWVYVQTDRTLTETITITIAATLDDGRTVTRSATVRNRAFRQVRAWFGVGCTKSVNALTITETALPTLTEF